MAKMVRKASMRDMCEAIGNTPSQVHKHELQLRRLTGGKGEYGRGTAATSVHLLFKHEWSASAQVLLR